MLLNRHTQATNKYAQSCDNLNFENILAIDWNGRYSIVIKGQHMKPSAARTPFDCQSTVNNIFIKRKKKTFKQFLFIVCRNVDGMEWPKKGTTNSTDIDGFGHRLTRAARPTTTNQKSQFIVQCDCDKKRCGIQVVWLHVKSIHQENVRAEKYPSMR